LNILPKRAHIHSWERRIVFLEFVRQGNDPSRLRDPNLIAWFQTGIGDQLFPLSGERLPVEGPEVIDGRNNSMTGAIEDQKAGNRPVVSDRFLGAKVVAEFEPAFVIHKNDFGSGSLIVHKH
jgi:hypothetical protein